MHTINSPSRAILVAMLWSMATASIALAQAPTDALADARQKFAAGEYRPALQVIAAELSQNRPANSREAMPSPRRYELLMIRGECLIRVDQRASGADAFSAAEKSASSPQEFAIAHASSMLIKASPNNKYTGRGGTGSPFDILNTDSRKQAFAALREDRLATLKPKLDRAGSSTTLPPMFEVLQPLLDIAVLEFAANGSAVQTRVTLMDLGTHARGLINAELKRIDARLNALGDASNSVTGAVGVDVGYVVRRGLYSNEAQEVRETVQYLGQIDKTARDVRTRAQKLGLQADAWEPIIADTADLVDRANAMLNIVP